MNAVGYEKLIKFMYEKCPDVPILVYGHSGIGKSAIPKSFAKENKIPFIYFNATGLQPEDLTGYPTKDAEGKYQKFLPPDFFKMVQEHPRGIIEIDEITRLQQDVLNVIMNMIENRELGNGSLKIPKGWLMVLACNPSDAGYHVADLDIPFVRRCMVMSLNFDIQVWSRWAEKIQLPDILIGAMVRTSTHFVKNPKEIKQESTAFGMEVMGKLQSAGVHKEFSGTELYEIAAGVLGPVPGQVVMNFMTDTELRAALTSVFDSKDPKFPKSEKSESNSPKYTELTYLFLDVVKKVPVASEEKGKVLQNCKMVPSSTVTNVEQSLFSEFVPYISKLSDRKTRGVIFYTLFRALPDDVKPILVMSMCSEIMYFYNTEKKDAYTEIVSEWKDLTRDMREKSKEWEQYYNQFNPSK